MLSIYLSITHSSSDPLGFVCSDPLSGQSRFGNYLFILTSSLILCVWAWHSEGVVCGTLWPHTTPLNWTNRLLTASSLFTRQSDRYQHCNFRKNTDRSSNSGSEQPQRNARHSSPYQNQVSRSGQENLEKFKFANWRKILWRKNVGRYKETKQHFILFYWKICLSDQTRTNW